jgi:hypothetical protein
LLAKASAIAEFLASWVTLKLCFLEIIYELNDWRVKAIASKYVNRSAPLPTPTSPAIKFDDSGNIINATIVKTNNNIRIFLPAFIAPAPAPLE